MDEMIDATGVRCDETCPEEDENNEGNPREDTERLWSDASIWPDGTLPQEGDNVTIPYEWNLVMDVNPPKLNYLEVNGILNFDDSRANVLEAKYIWVRNGKMVAGSQDSPFMNDLNIILNGEKDERTFVIDPATSGNKMLAVSGGLELYGNHPATIWTRLTSMAQVGATQITVESADGWNIGDKIAIAPSYSSPTQYEEVTIQGISGTTITFTPALQYEHYGDISTTLTNEYGTLDARSAVGHLTRNIKISGGADVHGWGAHVLILGYTQIFSDFSTNLLKGYAKLDGVEFKNCGQYDTQKAGLKIVRTGSPEKSTSITNSAIHHCNGMCSFFDDISDLTVNNNVFYLAKKYITYVHKVNHRYSYMNNLLIGAQKRADISTESGKDFEDTAAYEQYVSLPYSKSFDGSTIKVTGNLVQGSEGEGYVLPFVPCDYLDHRYPFEGNTAGSCYIGFIYDQSSADCLGAKGATGYATKVGLMVNPNGAREVLFDKMFFTDSKRGITLRLSKKSDDNAIRLTNSYVSGYSR
jgi:hypothetical protein